MLLFTCSYGLVVHLRMLMSSPLLPLMSLIMLLVFTCSHGLVVHLRMLCPPCLLHPYRMSLTMLLVFTCSYGLIGHLRMLFTPPPASLIWSMSLTVLMFVWGYGLWTDFRMLVRSPPPSPYLKHVIDSVDVCFRVWSMYWLQDVGDIHPTPYLPPKACHWQSCWWLFYVMIWLHDVGEGPPYLKHVIDSVDVCFRLWPDFWPQNVGEVIPHPPPEACHWQSCWWLFYVTIWFHDVGEVPSLPHPPYVTVLMFVSGYGGVPLSTPPPHHILLQCCWCLFQVGLWGNSWPHYPPSTHPPTRTPCLKPVTDSVVDVCFRLWSDYGPQDSGEEFPRHQGCHAQHETRRWHRCACQGCKTCEWLKYPFSLVSVI